MEAAAVSCKTCMRGSLCMECTSGMLAPLSISSLSLLYSTLSHGEKNLVKIVEIRKQKMIKLYMHAYGLCRASLQLYK